MIEKIGRRRYRIFAFDVESHNDPVSVANDTTGVWLYSFIDESSKIDDESSYGYDLEHFIDRLRILSNPKRVGGRRQAANIKIYVWNLAFEFSFLVPVFFKLGIKWKTKIEKGDSNVFNSVTTKTCSSVWGLTLKLDKWGGDIVFCDLCKIFPGSLRAVAKSLKLKTQKGEIDYTKDRRINYVVPQYEKEYCFNDTRIVMEIVEEMQKRQDGDFFKAMSAASYSARKLIKSGFPHAYKPLKAYRKYYPILDAAESEFLRNAVAGGITYAPSKWQFRDIRQTIAHVDAHQMHPSQSVHAMPCGRGAYFTGRPPVLRISCCHILVSYSGVVLHSIIKLIGEDFATDKELYVWNFEIPTMFRCYRDLEIKYIDGYAYHARFMPWRKYYADNYANRLQAKKDKDAFMTMYWKMLNNAGGFGKFVEHGHDMTNVTTINESGYIDSTPEAKEDASINATFTYIPVGACIPAYSRVCLIEAALKISPDGSKIVYFDTDSIFYIKDAETERGAAKLNYRDELGGWGREPDIKRAQFAAPKRYKLIEEGDGGDKLTLHMAGVNFVYDGDKTGRYDPDNEGKVIPCDYDLDIISNRYVIVGSKRAKGGTLIIFKNKEIGVQGKYVENFKANAHN